MNDLVSGARGVARGARFLAARPRLWLWVIAPAALSLAILVGVVWALVTWTDPLIAGATEFLPDAIARWVAGALRILLVLLLGLGGYFSFLSLTALVSAPFNEMLSEAVETEVTGHAGPAFSIGRVMRDVAVGIAHAARRVIAYLAAIAALLVLGLIVPVVGPVISAIGGAIVSARFASYDSFDAVWARKGWRYADKIAWLRANPGARYGLGGAVAALALVPIANAVALPIGAVGATLIHLDGERTTQPRAR